MPKKFDQKKILKVIKKKFACNGTIVNDSEMGEVIQLQGDQRKDVQEFLVAKDGLELDAKTIKVRKGNAMLFCVCIMTTLPGPRLLSCTKPVPRCSEGMSNSNSHINITSLRIRLQAQCYNNQLRGLDNETAYCFWHETAYRGFH